MEVSYTQTDMKVDWAETGGFGLVPEQRQEDTGEEGWMCMCRNRDQKQGFTVSGGISCVIRRNSDPLDHDGHFGQQQRITMGKVSRGSLLVLLSDVSSGSHSNIFHLTFFASISPSNSSVRLPSQLLQGLRRRGRDRQRPFRSRNCPPLC